MDALCRDNVAIKVPLSRPRQEVKVAIGAGQNQRALCHNTTFCVVIELARQGRFMS